MSRIGQSITLSISERDKAQLMQLAEEFGQTWGKRANISKLVLAIARRELIIAPNHDWSLERINALNQARAALMDTGRLQEALAIAQLLLERSELTLPLRQELAQFIEHPVQPWRLEVDRYILRNQPFQLSYQDAAGVISNFTIYYATIATHEERQYLDCWCEETNDSHDLAELMHNRTLRLDRIADAAISPVPGQWREEGLGGISVELHLYGSLAFAYRSKTARDEVNEWHPERPKVRRIVRQVTSSFWFTREILRYGKDCEVISPETVRDRIKQEVKTLYERYYTE